MTAPGVDPLLTADEVAALTTVSANTLYHWRHLWSQGIAQRGPASFKLHGRVVYRTSAVKEWIDEQERASALSA